MTTEAIFSLPSPASEAYLCQNRQPGTVVGMSKPVRWVQTMSYAEWDSRRLVVVRQRDGVPRNSIGR